MSPLLIPSSHAEINRIDRAIFDAKPGTGSELDSHVYVRRLEAALVDVVMGEGLRGVRTVLVHRDRHLGVRGASARHYATSWGHQMVSGGQQGQLATLRALLRTRQPNCTYRERRERDMENMEQQNRGLSVV